jgi:phosphoketolase
MAMSETSAPLAAEELARLDLWWRAANYLSVGVVLSRWVFGVENVRVTHASRRPPSTTICVPVM